MEKEYEKKSKEHGGIQTSGQCNLEEGMDQSKDKINTLFFCVLH